MAKKRTKTEQQMTPERERKLAIKAYKERLRYARKKGKTPYEVLDLSKASIENIKSLRGEALYDIPSWELPDIEDDDYDENYPPKTSNLNMQIIEDITAILDNFDATRVRAIHGKFFARRKQQVHDLLDTAWKANLADYDDELYMVAYRLEQNADEFKTLTSHLLYDSDSITEESLNIRRWFEMLYGGIIDNQTALYLSDLAEASGFAVYW